ncbi:L,D-transpeptidase catalytic domain [Propionibacterium cyclohexanicum]|uniref:L,D-transpeptidase catalytic domain n=1 Tax=Propionibacterium cyclohexanicum TaxID=64702 RepID=A0A1H9RPL5_9ACTN|nr:Ig-like domain-containing protein [Propionibacterium cyclohexanicum]SER74646.1 L,D-transpeptidase catalytic domain [Propionibacterium cyclohexanicum]
MALPHDKLPRLSRRTMLSGLAVGMGAVGLAACAPASESGGDAKGSNGTPVSRSEHTPAPTPIAAPVLAVSGAHGAEIYPDDPLTIAVTNGTVQSITVTDANGKEYKGSLSGQTWKGERNFWPAKPYTVTAEVLDNSKTVRTLSQQFTTKATDTIVYLPTYATPNLGIGMPVYIQFRDAISDKAQRAEIERHATVTTHPEQAGSWGWVANKILMWRPQNYWEPGSTATVDLQFGGLKVGDGVYLADDSNYSINFGEAHLLKVDLTTQHMLVFKGGAQVRDCAVSTGKAGHETFTGTKVIMEKLATMVMDSSTYGVPATAAEGYKLDVANCQRVTWSGEFLHGAPWSVPQQGNTPTSHGCTNLSPDDAAWLFGFSLVGDPVEFSGNFPGTNSTPFQPDDGIGCWVYDWASWQQQSAQV